MTQSKALYRDGSPLRENIGEKIRSRIFDGTYVPGTRLTERSLADEFEVSRSPIREAIHMLGQEGLIESLPTRGMVVKKLTREELVDIFNLREALEGLAAKLAAQRVAGGAINRLGEQVQRSQHAVSVGNFDAANIANAAFHDDLIALSGSNNLQIALTPLLGRLHWIFRQVLDFKRVYQEHEELAAAIDSGDPQRARITAEEHVESYRKRTLQYLFD